MIRRK